jgi:DNA-binding NarL/FixJ family response regulator
VASGSASRVIVLTTFDTDDTVIEACGSGRRDSCSRTSRRTGSSPRCTRPRRASATLTEREREVALAVARGLSNAEIAAELYMSVPTVKTHVSRILMKLDATNRVQAAIVVHDAGLV